MQATVDLPENLLLEVEAIARREGSTSSDVIRKIVQAHLGSSAPGMERRLSVSLPLIPFAETGPIRPINGSEVDALFSRDDFTA
jgi:hypothetical protein